MRTYRNDAEYVKRREGLKRIARRKGIPCAWCNEPIDFEADWKHPLSFTADHIEAVANGGSMHGPLQPMHRSCNSKKSNRVGVSATGKPDPVTDWY